MKETARHNNYKGQIGLIFDSTHLVHTTSQLKCSLRNENKRSCKETRTTCSVRLTGEVCSSWTCNMECWLVIETQGFAFLALRYTIECLRSNTTICRVISGSRGLPIAAFHLRLRIDDRLRDLVIYCRLALCRLWGLWLRVHCHRICLSHVLIMSVFTWTIANTEEPTYYCN